MRHVWITYAVFAVIELWLAVHFPESDVGEYHRYATMALTSPIFHHWPREYPAVSLFVFLLPVLLPVGYRLGFALFALLALAVLVKKGTRHFGPLWGMRLLLYLGVGTVGLFSERYDIFASLAAFAGVEFAFRKKWLGAWAFVLLGFLLKLFPAVFWPVFLIQEHRETGRWRFDRLALSLGIGLVVIGGQALLAQHQAFTSYRYLLDRPVEIGSLAASLTALFTHFHIFYAFGSQDVRAHGMAAMFSDGLSVAGIIAWLVIFYQQLRGRLSFEAALILTLGVLLLTTKVFSAQYLIWLAPLIAMRRLNGYLIFAYLLTTIGYPVGYAVPGLFPAVIYLFLARNVLLLIGLGVVALPRRSAENLEQGHSVNA